MSFLAAHHFFLLFPVEVMMLLRIFRGDLMCARVIRAAVVLNSGFVKNSVASLF